MRRRRRHRRRHHVRVLAEDLDRRRHATRHHASTASGAGRAGDHVGIGPRGDRCGLGATFHDFDAVARVIEGDGGAEAVAFWQVVEHISESNALGRLECW